MTDNQTISAYNQYSDAYDEQTKEFWSNFPRADIASFVSALPGPNVLNLGSGPGRDAILLRNAGLNVACIDGSVEMVRHTNALGFESRLAEFESLTYPNDSFDGVWAYTSLFHIPKIEMLVILKRVHAWLKPKGCLFQGMFEGDFEGQSEIKYMPNAPRYIRLYSETELIDCVEQSGFRIIRITRYRPNTKTLLNLLAIKN
jgi:SAM-dependent methyltransferase